MSRLHVVGLSWNNVGMDDLVSQLPQRRRLAADLRHLRLAAGLSGEQLAERLGVTQSKVSKIETGRTSVTAEDADAWAQAVGADAAVRAELVQRAEAVRTESLSWRVTLREGVSRRQEWTGTLEASSGLIRVYQPTIIPGLLQTAEYTRRLLPLADITGQKDHAQAVNARLQRQAVLHDEGKRFEFLITEAALHWRPGPPSVLVAQLHHIATLLSLSNVMIGVIPLDAEASALCFHAFHLYAEREEGSVVTLETLTSEVVVSDPQDIKVYNETFERFREAAFFGEDARNALMAVASSVSA
jgi:transcriptional regulator with XRE-family HTH domain